MTRRRALLAVSACLTLAAPAGCGDDDRVRRADGVWGELSAAVALVPDTAERAALRYVGRLQTSNGPGALALYAPAAREAAGVRRLASTVERVGSFVTGGEVDAELVESTASTASVDVTIGRGTTSDRYRFRLVRRRGRWLIVHDELTRDALRIFDRVRTGEG